MQVRRKQVEEILKSRGVSAEDIEITTDKTYKLADILFDLWLASKKQ